MYDPRDHGADCDNCPLNKQKVVPPEIRENKTLIIGEAPGFYESKKGAPFVGASGRELEITLNEHGLKREDVSLTNALLCSPPKNNLTSYLRKISKQNRENKDKENFVSIKNPLDCCYSRLKKEIVNAPSVILLGATALRQGKGEHSGEEGLRRKRGYIDTLKDEKKCLTTWHPAFVLRSRRWTDTFRSDIGKAFRYFNNNLRWQEPEVMFNPSSAELDCALNKLSYAKDWVAIDTETDGLDPELVNLRCVGIANKTFGVVLGFDSVERPKRTFNCPTSVSKERLSNFFKSYSKLCGHNINLYDRPVLERHGIYLPPYEAVVDTVILSHIADSELPNDLGYLSSRYTDAPSHKPSDHDAWQSDKELHVYCGWDCAITSRLLPLLAKEVKETNQERVYWSDIRLQELCSGMHRAGMLIDSSERKRHELRLRTRVLEAQFQAKNLIGKEINLFSHDQVRDYLYYNLKLPIPSFITDSEEPSTNRDSMYELLQMGIPEMAREFIHILLDARMSGRALSKDVMGLTPDKNGRIHSTFIPHGTITGRLSSQNPNIQNIASTKLDSDSLRSMYIAAPGNVLVSCDLEQVELRLVALLSNDKIWLEAFEKGLDVHKVNAATFFNTKYEEVEGYQRSYGKSVCYMYLYGGGAKKALVQMRQVRDPVTKERPYAKLTLLQAKVSRDKLLGDHPALENWWLKQLDTFHRDNMLRSIVLGRARKFLDASENDNEYRSEIINFQIQSTTADVMSGEIACGKLIDSIGWKWTKANGLGGQGIIHHGHDSLMIEVPENKTEIAVKAIENAMNFEVEFEGRKIKVPAKAKIGKKWSEV